MLGCDRFRLVTPDIWKTFSSMSLKILMVDYPELRDSATYKLKRLKPSGNGQLEFILNALSPLWAVLRCNVCPCDR